MATIPIFTNNILLPTSNYRSQGNTSSCWAFSVVSFLESELNLMSDDKRLSPWYLVRRRIADQFDIITSEDLKNLDINKSNISASGKRNIPRGGIGNTALYLISKYGIAEETDHNCNIPTIKENKWGMKCIKGVTLLAQSVPSIRSVCRFMVEVIADKLYGKISDTTGRILHPDISKYKEYTSFCHLPYHKMVNLDVPDNFYNGKFYNLPLDDLIILMKRTLEKGHTIVWDGGIHNDVIYSSHYGIAKVQSSIKQEISEAFRSECFLTQRTTDDHMVHIIGLAHDEDGRTAFIAKDSAANANGKLMYLYEDFVRLKTVSVLL